MDAKVGYMPSYAWRSIMSARVSQVKILHEDAVVSALIDQDTKQWKRDLIFSIFNTFEARQITSIPLSFRLPEDTFIWDGEKDGKYSVRSAYHLLGEERRKELPASSTTNDKPWKGIWSINLPNRVVWFSSSLGVHVPLDSTLNQWLHKWLMGKDTLGAQIFCSIMWKLLYARNQIIFNQANPFPPEIANAARDFVVDFNEAVPKKTKSCFSDGYTAYVCVFKDYTSLTTFSACKKEQMTADPKTAEALGIRWCMQLAKDQRIKG
ncbi:hypothetical protein MTR_1g033950 [Medicago truncatula]|uniref:Uncharacterized protein n=1 Tax=Medicago truncatula TaxID=3880 RepID=A0A072VRH5_MEDTR|nr:hypothetical protein MTR_1g033950 [Medicago truncatula]